MKKYKLKYTRSKYIFPCIGVSNEINKLKQLNLLISLNNPPKIYYKSNLIIEINTNKQGFKTDWFGDCIYIYNPASNYYFFIGLINNYLFGFGNWNFKMSKKNIILLGLITEFFNNYQSTNPIKPNGDLYLELFENLKDKKLILEKVKGFVVQIPYKNYRPQIELIQWFKRFEEKSNAWDLIRDYFFESFKWKLNAPRINEFDIQEVWNDSWILYRLNMYNPESSFKYNWIVSSRENEYKFNKISGWNYINIIEDLKWYNPNLAVDLLKDQFGLIRENDGGNESQPPLLSYCFLELAKLIGNYNILENAYQLMIKNLKWLEKNRYFEEYGLFGYRMKAKQILQENSLENNTPRFFNQFDGKKWIKIDPNKERKIIAVDLNSQMADYYQNLGVIGMLNEDEKSNKYFEKAEKIIENVQQYLWNDENNFFFDYDLETKTQQPIYTSSSFWTLFGGCCLKGQLSKFIDHLVNPNEFWTDLPIPSISINSPFFNNDLSSGAAWISQNYWLIIGLRRYNLEDLAAQLSRKILNFITKSYLKYRKFYEFYNPINLNQNNLKWKKEQNGPAVEDVGNFPIHSIYYHGLLGAEIVDDCLTFYPNWKYIPSDLSIKLYYNGKIHEISAEKYKTKIIEIRRD